MTAELTSTETAASTAKRGPWWWVPSLYFAQGLPFVVVMTVSVILYKRLGVSNTQIALFTSLLYVPWVVKPLWSPIVDVLHTKRSWIVTMQLLIGTGLAGVALAVPANNFFYWTLAFFWMLAFASATHDIAADGFYMLAMPAHDQAWFVGIRSTCYRIAMIAGQGLLVMIAGWWETHTGFPDVPIQIRAVTTPSASASTPQDWTAWKIPRVDGPLRLVAHADALEVGLTQRNRDDVAQIIEAARRWNIDRGFYQHDTAVETEPAGKSQWRTALEKFIVRYFGSAAARAAPGDAAGDVTVILLAATRPVAPGEAIDVVIEPDSGDVNFRVIEGSRFSIAEANWDQPFVSVVQVDHRVVQPTATTFRARTGNFKIAWASTFYLAAGIFLGLCAYHVYALPRPVRDRSDEPRGRGLLSDFVAVFITFFQKKHNLITITFLLVYRFAEAQLVKLTAPFLLESRERGGLALSTGEVGFVYGTIGVLALVIGGILGGWAAARNGLRFWLPWMALAINLPNLAYVFLSYDKPDSFLAISTAIAVEQFGYGFGFAGYMLYMLYAARGEHETAHYAICTGFMALGMMLPGMTSGWLQDLIGYQHFFVWVVLATIPSFLVTVLVLRHLDPSFGRREDAA